jgi:hypothetical protein
MNEQKRQKLLQHKNQGPDSEKDICNWSKYPLQIQFILLGQEGQATGCKSGGSNMKLQKKMLPSVCSMDYITGDN